ncbi:MAG TPA: WecB/TagA/CpsF family glycosyltransferase, partial [Prolixibacteraceae bacterium]|nr:WecB/TagA/CpsF family glycosyltransferase [Prolixibacteraceae bacterium]
NILDFNIDTSINQLDFSTKSLLINTINPHSYCVTKKDTLFKEALQKSDVLIPDGIGIVIAAKLLANEKIERIAGADLHEHILKLANQNNGKVFYLGSMPSTLQKIKERLSIEYPNILFECYSPPYKLEFTSADNKAMLEAVNAFKPNALFIGMTAPKQEKWAYQHKDSLDVNIIASIGAVFDFYAGTVKRPGKFWQKSGLEWLPRLLREPKRLWRRTIVSTPCFLWDVLKAKMAHRF